MGILEVGIKREITIRSASKTLLILTEGYYENSNIFEPFASFYSGCKML